MKSPTDSTQAPATPSLVERLGSKDPLPLCPYDQRSPDYWTTPDDDPCKICGQINDVNAPDVCRGADTRVMDEAADALKAQQARIAELEKGLRAVEPWLTAALECPTWVWDADQREAATQARDDGRQALRHEGGEG